MAHGIDLTTSGLAPRHLRRSLHSGLCEETAQQSRHGLLLPRVVLPYSAASNAPGCGGWEGGRMAGLDPLGGQLNLGILAISKETCGELMGDDLGNQRQVQD